MKKQGLDPEKKEDAEAYYIQKRLEFMKEMREIIFSYQPDATVFFNGGADMYRPQYHDLQTHYELEDLPTSGGGYDKLPIRAKFFSQSDKYQVGMTGKFHAGWGEFGGFKNPEALKYECANFLSFGAGCSVGDQMHPCGELDMQTYKEIGHAYKYVKSIENYCFDSKDVADLGIFTTGDEETDQGLNVLLLENQIDYALVRENDSLDKLNCLILPSGLTLSQKTRKKVEDYIAKGGKIIIMGDSVRNFNGLGLEYVEKSKCDIDYIKTAFDIGEISPFLFYESSHIVRQKGYEVLAEVFEPYFNRTYAKYCSHGNTPFRLEPAQYAGMLKKDNIIYISHDVCKMYHRHAAYYHKKYFTQALKMLYTKRPFEVDLMSCGRARMRINDKEKFYALHLLYAPFHNRGDVCVLEDFPVLQNIPVKLNIAQRVKRISLQPQNKELKWKEEGSAVSFKVPKLKTHQLIVIEYEE